MKVIDLSGQKFGRLKVVGRAESEWRKNMKTGRPTKKEAMWLCQCECGNSVSVRAHSLKHGDTKSCGCLAKEQRADRKCQKCKQFLKKSEYVGRYGRICSRCRLPEGTPGVKKSYVNRSNRKRKPAVEADDLALKMARMKW